MAVTEQAKKPAPIRLDSVIYSIPKDKGSVEKHILWNSVYSSKEKCLSEDMWGIQYTISQKIGILYVMDR